jgi:uncharacterized protein (TIGR02246 family)
MTGHATEPANLGKTRQAHIAALNAGDAHRWAACFAADAVQMPPNQPPNVGAESIRAWSGAFLAAFAVKFSLRPDEVTHTGTDWAFERGTYTIILTPATGGTPARDTGKYITIYQRYADDSWVMARDTWNSNNPPAQPGRNTADDPHRAG